MKKVFLSYTLADAAFAHQLAASLRPDTDVIDLTSTAGSGEQWSTLLRDGLSTAEAMVLLVSRRALESTWLNFEIGAAVGMGKRVVPVFLDDPKHIDWDRADFVLRGLRYVDVHGMSAAAAADAIRQAIAA
ncbi:MAG: toll/interleukin-1 receptor domain-containing protein [Gemmatimonadaceae bacterium]